MPKAAALEKAQALRTQIHRIFGTVSEGAGPLSSSLLFWQQSLKNPVQICSVFPSRPSVGKSMCEAVGECNGKPVIELGAGTGAITRQLLGSGIKAHDLTAVELDREFASFLSRKYPGVDVLNMGAEEIADLWLKRKSPKVGAVVSTLPIKLFDDALQHRILGSMLDVMAEDASFVQLTYRLKSPIKKEVYENLGLKAKCDRAVWQSIPPAFIWKYERA
ncbi:Phospholipid N-methyltransferase [Cohaesibacter sp. ES.047]|uniref:class I SAM-dependent methyltransferase n=1 Tax=Cohaesibacter sp. ES.047 TaxID=1798205 RepID=UPI000BB9595E|nr:hypothetical protein [Cohaesibacter sp. ES.047]SNY92899.1 Phospholipid N-methyltransferase [Cohaesibacter sp. ES.047]